MTLFPQHRNRLLAITACLFILSSASSQELINCGDPAQIGISSERLELIDDLIEEFVDNKSMPGGTFLIARKGQIFYNKSFGYTDLSETRAYAEDDIFRLASMTKAVTAVAIMQLVERGKLRLNAPIKYYIPGFSKPKVIDKLNQDSTFTTIPAEKDITIRHLLTHTSGIGYGDFDPDFLGIIYEQFGLMGVGLSHNEMTTKDLADRLAEVPLAFHPGEKYLYGLNMDILGRIVEIVSGEELDDYFKKNIFDPLGMTDTWFYLPKDRHGRLVDVYTYNDERQLIMAPPEAAALSEYPTNKDNNFYAGGGGLSGTAMDYAKFIQALLNNGKYNGSRILGRKSIETIATDQLALLKIDPTHYNQTPGLTMGLGFGVTMPQAEGYNAKSVGTYEWGGMFNTKFFIDPEEEIIFVGMTQIVPFTRPDFWERLTNILYSSIID